MGWVLYENYPLDQDPHGSSTLLQVPNENFAGVDSVAIMFSWQDVETHPDEYDFSKVDFAYDYWAHRGKAIQLRLSTETLLWWTNRNPPTGKGVPDYVLAKLSPDEKQTRELQGVNYVVPDARNAYYRERLKKFLLAINEHFSDEAPGDAHRPPRVRRVGRMALGLQICIARAAPRCAEGHHRDLVRRTAETPTCAELLLRSRQPEDALRRTNRQVRRAFDDSLRRIPLLFRVRLCPDEAECHLPTRRLRRRRSFQ